MLEYAALSLKLMDGVERLLMNAGGALVKIDAVCDNRMQHTHHVDMNEALL